MLGLEFGAETRLAKSCIVALVTPMHRSGEVDWPALDRLVDWHLESGTHGIVEHSLFSLPATKKGLRSTVRDVLWKC